MSTKIRIRPNSRSVPKNFLYLSNLVDQVWESKTEILGKKLLGLDQPKIYFSLFKIQRV